MKTGQLVLAALGITVTLVGVGVVVAQLAPPEQTAAESSPSEPGQPPSAAGSTPTASSPPDAPAPARTPLPDADPQTDADTNAETNADAPRTSTEVLPAEPNITILPPSTPRTALVSPPLPPTASSLGTLVSGFPTDVMPGIPDSLIDSSSVATAGARLQAALEARTTLRPEDVLAFYRQHFAPLGMLETPTEATKRSTTLSFGRGDDSVTLAVTAVAGGSSYVLFGAFTAAD